MRYSLLILGSLVLVSLSIQPIAVFHGMGDDCINPGMSQITKYLGKQASTYSTCIEVGSPSSVASLTKNFQEQAEYACKQVQNDPKLMTPEGINVIGLSQGSLIARHVATRCEGVTAVAWGSIGGPNQGVAKLPHCDKGPICSLMTTLTDVGVYWSFIQNHVGPAGYFRSLKVYDNYIQNSVMLADLNNEKTEKDDKIKQKFSGLKQIILWMFSKDTMVHPKESEWFGYYVDEDYSDLANYTQTDLFKEDWIGLKHLHESGKIQRFEIPGDHLKFSYQDLDAKLIPYLQ